MSSITQLFRVYHEGFKPPFWVKTYNMNRNEYQNTICYYDADSSLHQVKRLMRYREPVNIAMNRLYSQELLREYFGYARSCYNTTSPNIAVYCHTPCIKFKSKRYIHVLNVIGVALDDPTQPDYQRISSDPSEYKRMVSRVFRKIRYCFYKKPFHTMVLHGFGLGVFSLLAQDLGINAKEVFLECFHDTFNDCHHKKIICNFMPFPIKGYKNIKVPVDKLIFSMQQEDLDGTLFINAWDAFSLIGNGNSNDPSLDGHFGRMTCMSVLGWSITNPCIQYEAVPL